MFLVARGKKNNFQQYSGREDGNEIPSVAAAVGQPVVQICGIS